MTDQFIFDYIDRKEQENTDIIRYSYYELKIKSNLTDEEIDKFLKVNRDYFENHGYRVYFTNARYEYKGATQNVQSNELMVAIKDEQR